MKTAHDTPEDVMGVSSGATKNQRALRSRALHTRSFHIAAGLCTLLAGCSVFKTPSTPAEQANAAVSTDGHEGAWIGHLDGNLSPIDGKDVAFSAQSDLGLHFSGVSDGQLCFAVVWDQQFFPSHDTVEAVAEARMAAARATTFVFEARDALDYTPQSAWPANPANQVQSVTLTKNKRTAETHTRSDYTTWTSENLKTRIELCGAAPKVSATTKYLTLIRFKPEPEKAAPALYIWKIDGAIDSSLITGAASTTADAPSARPRRDAPEKRAVDTKPAAADPAVDPPIGAPVSGNLIEVMTAAGKYSTFLKLVEAAGLTERLKSSGTYTVFAPTNHAFDREPGYFMAGLRKDKVALAKLVRAHITTTAYPRATLEATGSTDVKTMNSPKEVRAGNGHITLGNTTLSDEQQATNGMLWATDAVMKN